MAIREGLPRRVTVRFAQGDGGSLPDIVGVRVVSSGAARWELEVVGPMGPLLDRLHGLPVADIDVKRASLEDYVLRLYSDRR